MNYIIKIAAGFATASLTIASIFASVNKPKFTFLNTVFYTNGGASCGIMRISTPQMTTNGNPGVGARMLINPSNGGAFVKFWGACSSGNGTHPAHFHS